jgi:predicted RNA-binding Zn ribbon-like protein|tara:strand:- start:1491 stop:1748 length:258 start_codon:yes stop_codon:yes gene_type:complete
MNARVAFKKRKVVHERVVWIVSVFDDPNDIRNYDSKTMSRLQTELYGKNSKSEKQVIIREIIDKKFVSHSTLSLDEHRKQNKIEV